MTLIWILLSIVTALVVWLLFWNIVSFAVLRSSRQKAFVAGTIPSELPEGFYSGLVYFLGNRPLPWLGKSFDRANDLGFNIFTPRGASLLKRMTPFYKDFRVNGDGNTEAYNFRTSVNKGFKDKGVETIKLDYDSRENPFLIRIILDEIVVVAPDEYLGKVHLKVFPGCHSTIGFFGLKKSPGGLAT